MPALNVATLLAGGETLGDILGSPGGLRGATLVDAHGAVGDWNGTTGTDDTSAVQAAITASPNGAIAFTPGKWYRLSSGLTKSLLTEGLTILAYGARVTYTGSGAMFTTTGPNQSSAKKRLLVYGGEWFGTSAATHGFLLRDTVRASFNDVEVVGFANGYAWTLSNDFGWCEGNELINCTSTENRGTLDFEGLGGWDVVTDLTPNGGTKSFARTKVHNMRVRRGGNTAGGTPTFAHFRLRGSVYASEFESVTGNLQDGATVFYMSGGMSDTVIGHVDFENSNGVLGNGNLFEWGAQGVGHRPIIRGPIYARTNMVEHVGEGGNAALIDYWGVVGDEVVRHDAKVDFRYNDETAWVTGSSNPVIYRTNSNGGADPFNLVGNLIIQGKNSGGSRRVIIATGTTPAKRIEVTQDGEIGFFGVTPAAQPAANPDTSGAALADLETEVNQIKAALRSLGLIAT